MKRDKNRKLCSVYAKLKGYLNWLDLRIRRIAVIARADTPLLYHNNA